MKVTRRDFLKLSGATAAAAVLSQAGFDLSSVKAKALEFKIASAQATPTICPYCSCGCGILVYTKDGKVVGTEGDPDHPINRGSLCSKGSALAQVATSEKRVKKVLYRAPGSGQWEEKDWEWALTRIAENIKKTRDASFEETIKREDGSVAVVNRTEAIAQLGGAALDNEECYLAHKFARAIGIVYMEHQARI